MSTDTRTASTAFGEIEYETVECASCNTEVRKEDARPFIIGELQDRTTWSALNKDQFEFRASSVQTGFACSYCREQGIFGFPENRLWDVVTRYPMILSTAILIFVALFSVVLALVTVAA